MKSLLTLAALLALAAPALADDAATPQAPAVIVPATEAVALVPAQPQAKPVVVVPLSAPAAPADAARSMDGGGCHHQTTVYLTN